MAIKLGAPLPESLNAEERAMLARLQGNILKSHGRDRTAHVFVRIKSGGEKTARAFLKKYAAEKIMSAADQLRAVTLFRRDPKSKDPIVTGAFITVVLSRSGYDALGLPAHARPHDPAFNAGLKARRNALNDPTLPKWHVGYRGELHVMILIAGKAASDIDETSAVVEKEIKALVKMAPASAIAFVGIERGRAYRNANGDGLEHFGYVDGRSQPLLTDDDVKRELKKIDGPVKWEPAFPLKQVLVADPFAPGTNSFGSYFVFRKLEQNVKGFKDAEADLQTKLEALAVSIGKTFPEDLAGAMIVGRFEDGTPVSMQDHDGLSGKINGPVRNNFEFNTDANALKCPFHAHIRKTNPRGDSVALGATLAQERAHIMARRGITYGARKSVSGVLQGKPTKGVGLLFMAYQSSIVEQFEFTQASWANDAAFARQGTGIDPVLGQGGANPAPQTFRAGWYDAAAPEMKFSFANFVSMKGGEYFFAPSLTFFEKL